MQALPTPSAAAPYDSPSAAADLPLTVEQAVRRYGTCTALHGVSFQLHAGELLALLGPNGAGKTTLIRCIAGRLKLHAGRITILGHDRALTPPAEIARQLGVIPQDIALYARLTARENLQLFGRLQGVPAAALPERIDWALAWSGLADRADDQASRFSGGMQRRLNIACGILHRPRVILLDEPTVGVDPQSRQRIRQMLQDLRAEGASILLTTHQLDEAQQLCDRIVIMDGGRSIAAGTFDQLVAASVGQQRRVLFQFSRPLEAAPPDFTLLDPTTLATNVHHVGSELAARLQTATALDVPLIDIRIEAPTLQSVFMHFTGHELREH